MPRNNSKARKDERRMDARDRQALSAVRTCGHTHISDKQWQRCPLGKTAGEMTFAEAARFDEASS